MRSLVVFYIALCCVAVGLITVYYSHVNLIERSRPLPLAEKQQEMSKGAENKLPLITKIIYNRVGKCGSRSMEYLILALSKKNGYKVFRSQVHNYTRPSIIDLTEEVDLITNLDSPVVYSRHLHFVNFLKFGLIQPVYINLIRDPIARFSSAYHFRRFNDKSDTLTLKTANKLDFNVDMNINDCVLSNHIECSEQRLWYVVPYFCGQEAFCMTPGPESLRVAKEHLLNNYLAVGILEDFEGTLKVFEKLLPFYFDGATEHWKGERKNSIQRTETIGKQEINPRVYGILKQRMALEYEFYEFATAIFNGLKRQMGIK